MNVNQRVSTPFRIITKDVKKVIYCLLYNIIGNLVLVPRWNLKTIVQEPNHEIHQYMYVYIPYFIWQKKMR
jgi:hypothetical protein